MERGIKLKVGICGVAIGFCYVYFGGIIAVVVGIWLAVAVRLDRRQEIFFDRGYRHFQKGVDFFKSGEYQKSLKSFAMAKKFDERFCDADMINEIKYRKLNKEIALCKANADMQQHESEALKSPVTK